MTVIPFAEWRPDMPDLGEWARTATNVIPTAEAYAPMPALSGVSSALTARAQGACWFRGTAGAVKMFAGDATKLYLLGGTTWSDVTRVTGGAYAPGADGTWRFTQFGTLAIAVNGVDNPQSFDLGTSTNFALMAGSPPIGTYIATVRDFVVMGKIGSTRQRVQWSPFNNATGTWGSVAATQADFQDLPDGGDITGLVSGEYGLIFQEDAVRRMTYEGSPIVFRIDKIANGLGCSVPNSIAAHADKAFFLHKSGFWMCVGGQQLVPIGHNKIDKTFRAEFDETNYFRCSAAIDPVRQLYFFAYPANGSGGTPNRLLVYDWSEGKWTRIETSVEIIFAGISQQSYTLEGLDAVSSSLDALPFSLDSSFWSGTQSLLLFGFDTSHKSGSFSGDALAATLETAEINPGNGMRTVVKGCRPLIDGGSPTVQVGSRETQQATVSYSSAASLTSAGKANLYQSGRYHRFKATIPAASTWSNAQGIDDVDARPMGVQ